MVAAEFKQQLDEYIQEKVDHKIIALSKVPGFKIDKEQIVQECKNEVLREITKEAKIYEEGTKKFQTIIQEDDPQLSLKLTPTINTLINVDKEKLTAVKPERPDLERLREMGMNWFDSGDWSKAYYYFIYLSQVDAENPVTWLLRGMAEHNLKQLKDAIVSYTLALAFAPQYMYAHIQLIKGLIEFDKIEDAKQRYNLFMQTFERNQYEQDEFIASELMRLQPYVEVKM